MKPSEEQRNKRIIIVGAGPAGLWTAHFLKKQGYTDVIVLEKLGRVGGLCKTITAGKHSFDLGANYVTPAYKETRKLAEEVGAKLYSERPFVGMKVPPAPEKVSYESIFNALRVDRKTGEPVPALTFMGKIAKFCWLRYRLRAVIDGPTFEHVADYNDGELCQPLATWLEKHDLESIITLFDLPITMMGFGYVDQVAAAYAFKFMTLRSFIPMVLKETPYVGPLIPWPKRFVFGYQRLWERASWPLDVRFNVNIEEIQRFDDKVLVHFERTEQVLNKTQTVKESIEADYLVMACPLTMDVLPTMLDLSPGEKSLFKNVTLHAYCMTTFHVKNLPLGDKVQGAGPLAAAFYFKEEGDPPGLPMWKPWGVAKQWPDSDFVQYYSMTPYHGPSQNSEVEDEKAREKQIRERVIAEIRTLTEQMGGEIVDETEQWHTYNRWPYFQHVSGECMREGFYTKLEELQGAQRTFYVGGPTNFELVEAIANYAKHLVKETIPRTMAGKG